MDGVERFVRLTRLIEREHCRVRDGERSVNQSSVNMKVSTTVFNNFNTVLELLEVCLACHMPVLCQIVETPLNVT